MSASVSSRSLMNARRRRSASAASAAASAAALAALAAARAFSFWLSSDGTCPTGASGSAGSSSTTTSGDSGLGGMPCQIAMLRGGGLPDALCFAFTAATTCAAVSSGVTVTTSTSERTAAKNACG